jgi:hydroxyacylglutathione hydrolase
MGMRLLEKLASGVSWFDDWYAVETIAPGIHAIGEPLYHQINWNYLIEGDDRALLFDTGPGERDISFVVRALTSKPVVAMPSHMHFDHTGNLHRFDCICVTDLQTLRECVDHRGLLDVPDILHLGSYEQRPWKPVVVTQWVAPGATIDLGGRMLDVIATPGHAVDHVVLMDRATNIVFAADFIYLGELYGQVPGADLADYHDSAQRLSGLANSETLFLGAHGKADAEDAHAAPKLCYHDLTDLIQTLVAIRKSGRVTARNVVNDRMVLLTSPQAFASWQTR